MCVALNVRVPYDEYLRQVKVLRGKTPDDKAGRPIATVPCRTVLQCSAAQRRASKVREGGPQINDKTKQNNKGRSGERGEAKWKGWKGEGMGWNELGWDLMG